MPVFLRKDRHKLKLAENCVNFIMVDFIAGNEVELLRNPIRNVQIKALSKRYSFIILINREKAIVGKPASGVPGKIMILSDRTFGYYIHWRHGSEI